MAVSEFDDWHKVFVTVGVAGESLFIFMGNSWLKFIQSGSIFSTLVERLIQSGPFFSI